MKPTDQTLMKQMHISSEEIEYRKSLLSLTNKELMSLVQLGIMLEPLLDQVVIEFYQQQTSVVEIATLIGDVDTLSRLQRAQRQYVTELSPPSKVGNYFGFANIFGRISAAIGPFIWATTILGLNQGAGLSIEMATRMGLVFIGSIMLIGYFIIMRVDDVHEIYLKGGRAKGDGTWVDDNNVVIYKSKM